MKNKYPVSRKDNLVVQEANGELLIYDLNDNKAYCLNETSSLIWNLCDGKSSISDISRSLGKQLNASVDEGLVWLALEQMKKEKLIQNEVTAPAQYAGLSRREVIKKVGLGSMIALPIISSLIAPTGAEAASGACLVIQMTGCVPAVGTPSANRCCSGNTCISTFFGFVNRCCAPGATNNGLAGNAPGTTIGGDIDTGANGFCTSPGPGNAAPAAVVTTCNNRAPQCCSNSATTVGNCVNGGGAGNNDSFNCTCV